MSPNETDINKLYREFYYYNQPVIITFDIEYVMLVAYVIHTVKRFLYIGKTRPLALLDYSGPFLQSHFRIGMSLRILFYRLFCKYSHWAV